jgi:hypothetical protein
VYLGREEEEDTLYAKPRLEKLNRLDKKVLSKLARQELQ